MNYRWALVVLLVTATTASAQESAMLAGAAPTVTDGSVFTSGSAEGSQGGLLLGNHSFANFINFVGNPLQNIDPRAVTAIYPLMGNSWTRVDGPVPDSSVRFYGPAMTIALTDRLAVGLNQGGFADVQSTTKDRPLLARLDPLGLFRDDEKGGGRSGFLNIGGFVQYTFIEDVADQFLLTGGLRWIAPCGSHEIFQGYGPLELAPYLTFGKELGKFHVLGTTGYQFPAGPGSDNLNLTYANVHLDRHMFDWLYPLVEFNCTWLEKSASFGLPTRNGFVDFGDFEAAGSNVTMSAGANAVLIPERLELGAVYSTPIYSQDNFHFNGFMVKMVLRF